MTTIDIKDLLTTLAPAFAEEAPEILVKHVTETLLTEETTLYDLDLVIGNIQDQNGSQDYNILAACLCLTDGSEIVDAVLLDGEAIDDAYMSVGALCDSWGNDGGALEHVLNAIEGLFDGVEGVEPEAAAVAYWAEQRLEGNYTEDHMARIDQALEWLSEALEAQNQGSFTDCYGAHYRPVPHLLSEQCNEALWTHPLAVKALRRLARVGALVEGSKYHER